MAEEVARLVAVVEADLRRFTKGMEDMNRIADRQFGALQKSMKKNEQSFGAVFGRGANALAARFLGLSAAIGVLNRIAREAAETNDEVKASVERMNEAYSRLGQSAGPGIAFLNNRMSDLLDSVNNVVTGLQRASKEIANSPIFGGKGGVNIPIAPNPFTTTARIDPTTKNVIPAPGGFAVPGVTDVTPGKGNNSEAERLAKEKAEIEKGIAQAGFDTQQEFLKREADAMQAAVDFEIELRQHYLDVQQSLWEEEADGLADFHERENEAWGRYYEGLAEKAEEDLELKKRLDEERKNNLQDTLGQISTLTRSSNDTLAGIGKAAAIAQATIDGIVAVQKALASAPPPFNFALAALVGAATAANVAEIAGMERGGRVQAGTPYIVGEKRPELFVPDSAGRIIPSIPQAMAAASGSGSSGPITISIDARGAQEGVAQQVGAAVAQAIKGFERRLPRMMDIAVRDHR